MAGRQHAQCHPIPAEVVLTLPKENIEALNDLVADWKDEICDEFRRH